MIDVLHRFHQRAWMRRLPEIKFIYRTSTVGYTLSTGFCSGCKWRGNIFAQPDHKKTVISVVDARAFDYLTNQQMLSIQSNIFTGVW